MVIRWSGEDICEGASFVKGHQVIGGAAEDAASASATRVSTLE
jgi:hypothetical protein